MSRFHLHAVLQALVGLATCIPSPHAIYADNPPPLPSVKNSTPSAEVRGAVAKGRSLRNAGDNAGARAAFDAALKQARETKDTAGEALALNNLASVYRYEAGLALITANQTPPAEVVAKSIDLY